MENTRRRKARPILLAVASAATLGMAACGDEAKHPTGNLLAPQHDLAGVDEAVPIGDAGPSGNLLVVPQDLESGD